MSSIQTLGLGKSPYQAQTDNWWERAFDNSLKSLVVSQSTDGGIRVVQEDVKGGGVGLNQIVKLGKGKYVGCINFVKGGSLEGTLSRSSVVPVTRVEEKVVECGEWSRRRVGKRKRGEQGEEARPERKKRRKEEKKAKEERRRLRREKRMSKSRFHEDRKTLSNSGLKKSAGVDSEPPNTTPPPPPTKDNAIEPMLQELPLPTPLVSRKKASNGEILESEVKVKVTKAKRRKGEKKAVEKCISLAKVETKTKFEI